MVTTPRPHVLLVTADQWAGKALGCAGHPVLETPTLDRLAHVGIRYARGYSESPSCIPARRSLMTGSTARVHGDRIFQPALPMPPVPTLAACFRNAGYQTLAAGKLHVFPKRDRIGFDDAIIAEEGRGHIGGDDDYDIFLADQGHPGAQFLHGLSNNEYTWRPWHLPEALHVTNWITATAARAIKRRDPTRPCFWHVSYTHPHPPLVPLASYVDRYADAAIPGPLSASWSSGESAPYAVRAVRNQYDVLRPRELEQARRAVYALSTHIDHQLRVIIGTLREEQLLEKTVILFCSDHGDMLGDFGLYGKRLMYESSANIPMILVDRAVTGSRDVDRIDDRLAGLQDVMPTLLGIAGIPVPVHCDGMSLVGEARRSMFYGESGIGPRAVRMLTDARFKLIWYPAGNVLQLFDLQADPEELKDLSADPAHAATIRRMSVGLAERLYGEDLAWIEDDRLTGLPAPTTFAPRTLGLSGQRGLHYPGVPQTDPSKIVGAGGE